jgi:hypothetical protein
MGKRLKKINWKTYNKKLIERGSITFWFPKDIEDRWLNDSIGPGFQKIYSDEAIEVVSMIRFFFKQPLRATQGFTGEPDGTSRVRSAGARLFDFIQKDEKAGSQTG